MYIMDMVDDSRERWKNNGKRGFTFLNKRIDSIALLNIYFNLGNGKKTFFHALIYNFVTLELQSYMFFFTSMDIGSYKTKVTRR